MKYKDGVNVRVNLLNKNISTLPMLILNLTAIHLKNKPPLPGIDQRRNSCWYQAPQKSAGEVDLYLN
jgi:hypothetical protein